MTDVSVIICAHNEEVGIGPLLSDVLTQTVPDGHVLREVLVVADGCTDRTVPRVRAAMAGDPRVRLLELPSPNRGKSVAFNEGVRSLTGDVVVMFDADVRIAHSGVVAGLLAGIGRGAVLVSGNDIPEPMPVRSVGHAASIGRHLIKQELKRTVAPHPNVYTCVGRVMAMRRAFCQAYPVPDVPGEDNFRYFTAVHEGLAYAYVHDAVVFFRPAVTLADYIGQHARFWHGVSVFRERFGGGAEYGSPVAHVRVIAVSAVHHPVVMAAWTAAAVAGQIVYWWQRYIARTPRTGVWEPASSTK